MSPPAAEPVDEQAAKPADDGAPSRKGKPRSRVPARLSGRRVKLVEKTVLATLHPVARAAGSRPAWNASTRATPEMLSRSPTNLNEPIVRSPTGSGTASAGVSEARSVAARGLQGRQRALHGCVPESGCLPSRRLAPHPVYYPSLRSM